MERLSLRRRARGPPKSSPESGPAPGTFGNASGCKKNTFKNGVGFHPQTLKPFATLKIGIGKPCPRALTQPKPQTSGGSLELQIWPLGGSVAFRFEVDSCCYQFSDAIAVLHLIPDLTRIQFCWRLCFRVAMPGTSAYFERSSMLAFAGAHALLLCAACRHRHRPSYIPAFQKLLLNAERCGRGPFF